MSKIEIKTPGQLEAMRASGLVVARALKNVVDAVKPGVSTWELDEIAEQTIRDAGAIPSFKGYQGFPASICASSPDATSATPSSTGGWAASVSTGMSATACPTASTSTPRAAPPAMCSIRLPHASNRGRWCAC